MISPIKTRTGNIRIPAITRGAIKYLKGFVDNVDVLMDASDCIITKPGGLTTSELLAKKLPAIIVNPIPGQEDRNIEFLVNSGAAIMATPTYPIDEALYVVLNNEWRMNLLKECVEHVGKPDSTEKLCEFIIEKLSCNTEEIAAIQ